jgi:hypothetical protein
LASDIMNPGNFIYIEIKTASPIKAGQTEFRYSEAFNLDILGFHHIFQSVIQI